VFLNWLVGAEKAHSAVHDTVEEHDLNPMPENISSAVVEDDVTKDLAKFEKYFTADAWKCVLEISNLL